MKKASSKTTFLLILSLVLTFAFIGGIPLIVLGATQNTLVLLIIGVICVVCGFYGMPLSWTAYGESKKLKRVVLAVESEHIYSVKAIATHLSVPPKVIKSYLQKCIDKGYLVGFLFDGENLNANFNVSKQEELISVKCESCGAKYQTKPTEKSICPYCGSVNERQN